MNNTTKLIRQAGLSAAFGILAAARTLAQTAPPASAATDTTKADSDETVVLSPFVITAEESTGYRATSTMAGTRIKTDLRDVGSAISVYTADFLKDTGATNTQSLLVYTTNTEVGGIGGNSANLGNGQQLSETSTLRQPQTNTRVRGLAAADNTRDYFLTDIPWDSYNVDRVDMQRGPNAILFGLGSPAGIINTTTKLADFNESASVELRYGSYGSFRTLLDINHVLLKGELAIRLEGLRDDTEYRQDPAFNLDKRFYGALRYDPKFLNKGSAHTSFRINYEKGDVSANRPRVLPPGDNITPWFSSLNKKTFDPFNSWTVDSANPTTSGQHQPSSPTYNPWLADYGNGQVQGGIYLTATTTGSSALSAARTGELDTKFGLNSSGAVDASIAGIQFNRLGGINGYSSYATYAKLPWANIGQYKDTYITDPSIFDFWNKLIDGPNARQWQGWDAVNAALSQTFFNNRLGIELAYDRQHYHDGQVSGGPGNIQIDLNTNLVDGSPNPNVGRPYVNIGAPYGNDASSSLRENYRVTAFGELRATDFLNHGLLADILGRHIFTGLYVKDRRDAETMSWNRWVADESYGENYFNTPYMTDATRQVSLISYIGPSLLNASSASGAHLSNVSATLTPPVSGKVTVFDSHWNATGVNPADPYTLVRSYYNQTPTGATGASTQSENPNNYVGWVQAPYTVLNSDTGDLNKLINAAAMTREVVDSKAFVWQGFLWDETFVGTVGIREDTDRIYKRTAGDQLSNGTYIAKQSDNSMNLNDPNYKLPSTPNNEQTGRSTTWSIVAHTPRFIRAKLPYGLDFSVFYDRSSNFEPAAGRTDVLGRSIASPNGETKEYGFLVSALDERISLKVNWYQTNEQNASLNNVLPMYQIGAAEQWGYTFAKINQNKYGPDWQWDYAANPWAGQTAAQAQAIEDKATAAWFANLPSDQFYNAWHIDRSDSAWQNRQQTYIQPQGLTATGDTMSKGQEYELTAQITKDWSLTLNASHDTARRVNVGGSLADWVNARTAVYNGDAGQIRYWWAGSTDTIQSVWNAQFLSAWKLLLLQQNADVPELRPWHFNLVTNYNVTKGTLKGFNVGGGYRWQDREVIGYPVLSGSSSNDYSFDLAHPYKGPAETNVDLWVGYQRKLTAKINWRIQLNVRNAFAKKELIPITTQPDGTPAAYRIPELTTWFVTNTFSF